MSKSGARRARVVGVVGSVVLGTLLARGCGSDNDAANPPTVPDAQPPGDAGQDVGRDTASDVPQEPGAEADVVDAGQPSCSPRPTPPEVPEGWEEYPVMDCKYRLYVPPSKDLLPSPLVWEACTHDLGPGGGQYDCRQIKVDWLTDLQAPYAIGGNAPAYVDENGKVIIQLAKVYQRQGEQGLERALMSMVVEADGPVRQAFWTGYQIGQIPPLWFTQRGVAPSKSSWYVTEWSGGTPVRHVSVGGDDTDLRPAVLLDLSHDDPNTASVIAGRDYYVETGYDFRVRSWDGADKGLAVQGAGAYSPPTWVGSTLLFAFESFPKYRVRRWTEQDGSKELVGFGSDTSKGAGFPGSDGKDLVWIQGEGLGPADSVFPTRSIMTSVFSSDPAEIKARRLRSWTPPPVGTPVVAPVVGCGKAAFPFLYGATAPTDEGLLVVRLADGVSWILPNIAGVGGGWSAPIAITCEEVFAMFRGPNGVDTIRRVRLDSLGPGEPPD